MCYGCYEEYGKPRVITKTTGYLVECIRNVYNEDEQGGNCHHILDDWNLEDDHLNIAYAELTPAEATLVGAMRGVSEDERATALALYEGWIDY